MVLTRRSYNSTPPKKRKRDPLVEEEKAGKRKASSGRSKSKAACKSKEKSYSDGEEEGGYASKKKEFLDLLRRWRSTKPLAFKEDILYAFYKGDSLYGRININCRISYIEDVELKLCSSDWRRILASPFGNVIRMMRQISFSSQTVHSVLFKQLKSKMKHETWYEIGGKEARFSIKEFALITGLNCGPLPLESAGRKKKKDIQVMEKFFGGPSGPKTSVQDLYDRFKEYRPLDNYKLKLALLLIVEGIFLGGDKKRLVKVEHVKLLGNMDKFWEYPWGRVAYNELHRSLTKSLSRRMLTVEKALIISEDARIPYTIQGMPVVFQVWIWESVKSVGFQFASKVSETAIPRGIRWSSDQCPEHGMLKVALAEPDLEVFPVLVPEEAEMIFLTGCRFRDEVKHEFFDQRVCEGVARNKANAKEKLRKRKDQPEVEADGNVRALMDMVKELCNKVAYLEHSLCGRIDRLEKKTDNVYEDVPIRRRKKRVVRKPRFKDVESSSASELNDDYDEYKEESESFDGDGSASENDKEVLSEEEEEKDEKVGSEDEQVGSDDDKVGNECDSVNDDDSGVNDDAVDGGGDIMDGVVHMSGVMGVCAELERAELSSKGAVDDVDAPRGDDGFKQNDDTERCITDDLEDAPRTLPKRKSRDNRKQTWTSITRNTKVSFNTKVD